MLDYGASAPWEGTGGIGGGGRGRGSLSEGEGGEEVTRGAGGVQVGARGGFEGGPLR